jgi:hypothetical protein
MTELSIDQLIDHEERIAIIGSPSSTSDISLDILGTAVNKKLVGEFGTFHFLQDEKSHYAMGQITEIQLKNIWLEDPTMRSLTRQRGQVNPISGIQDTHLGNMTISAVFSENNGRIEPSILGTVPQTGTEIHLVNDAILNRILRQHQNELFYLGTVYGSTPKLPMWLKHFGTGPGGAGEGYHFGIFGKSGSGKSVLAKMILLAYARHPEMGIFIIDPQGEFSKDARGDATPGFFNLNLQEILHSIGKPIQILHIRDLIFDRWELFEEILCNSRFFRQLEIPKPESRKIAAEEIVSEIRDQHIHLDALHDRSSFDRVWAILQDQNVQNRIYSTAGTRQRLLRAVTTHTNDPQLLTELYTRYWLPVCELFRQRPNALTVNQLVFRTFNIQNSVRPIVFIDLSPPAQHDDDDNSMWDEKIQFLMLKRLLEGIRFSGDTAYRENVALNGLVILDEAHRFAPSGSLEKEYKDNVRNLLTEASFETRKQGLGWMFISQTLSSLDKKIISQLRIYLFGFGLGLGSEYNTLSELVGKDTEALKLYRSFPDPHTAPDFESRRYSFMTYGPISPLSFQGTPLFLTVFNRPPDFLRVNHLIEEPSDPVAQPTNEIITPDH